MEEILSLVKQMQHARGLDPKIEDLVKRIDEIQLVECVENMQDVVYMIQQHDENILQGASEEMSKKVVSKDLCEANEQITALQRELEKLNEEESRLEEILNEKKVARMNLERHFEAREADMKRQQKLILESKQRIEELEAKIQEEKLKQRKQRMEFEQGLEELMEKHKTLWECHVRRNPMTEADKEVLLTKEKLIQEKLAHLKDELDLLRCSPFIEERRFLKSPAAACAMELFQEENKKAKEYLEATSTKNSDLQERCRRLKAELENLGLQDGGPEEQ